ncbi:hypothetical protein CABS01_00024 [Colletotrichum abscissum]|uniref:Uncharacterized protein n=2 Tax=Colletotrichum acutatum species complex TaxID=2707335 RepID=A0AAI9Z8C2_9PEZI|nr:uncharacterized protein CCOS01_02626 [Colletotrichum costaricense]XP_060383217.1 uncharacterized protein CTAM01_05997 [Colletotrichum tamarilloi]XP_060405922.1 uncharacterized protein CABS01_00024 [Colletotrichum abscissum]KAK1501272.1 hypothetical protein CTAM01_05997 [Colletotrichum tamarilloi]KAK1524935.1 hypothetical protein CABS01_00024 [Colletotrichum abscissum]KAK1537306.1 hypothetical protein CCOS01_02626 [Colletotrichum costaricense]
MAYSFTEEEKRFILAEAIKNSSLDVGLLVGFLKTHNVEPDWLKMQLPSGRTMGQCLAVTEQMFQGPMRVPDLKRKSMNDLLEQPPKRLAAASPMEPPAQLPPLASATQGLASYSSSMPVSSLLPAPPQLHNQQLANIQPRPAGMEIAGVTNGSQSPGQQQQAPLPRKRGRPSRADKARQLRPLLPQHLTPLAPAPRPIARESPTTPGEFAVYRLSPGPPSEAANEPTRRGRGRPKSFGRTQLGTSTGEQTKTESGRSTPSESSRQQSDDIPRDAYNEDENVSDSQKEKAISNIGHLQQEGLAS